jgi:DNA-binding CsgD family transcriptional regulator
VFGPGGRNGYFALTLAAGVSRVPAEQLNEFHWVCTRAHLRYCELVVRGLPPIPRLTQRETNVLLWISRGKSNAEIGAILGLSAYTVDTYVRAVFAKLGVGNRVSAAVRGLGLGLIHSDPDRPE